MRRIVALAIALAIPSAGAAKPPTREQCPTKLPFALPDPRLSEDWGDMGWELWAASAWGAYCVGRESSLACRCADEYGGGPY